MPLPVNYVKQHRNDGSYYFVNSSGAKVTSDWRLTAPYDDDDADADEYWYYLKSNGEVLIDARKGYILNDGKADPQYKGSVTEVEEEEE